MCLHWLLGLCQMLVLYKAVETVYRLERNIFQLVSLSQAMVLLLKFPSLIYHLWQLRKQGSQLGNVYLTYTIKTDTGNVTQLPMTDSRRYTPAPAMYPKSKKRFYPSPIKCSPLSTSGLEDTNDPIFIASMSLRLGTDRNYQTCFSLYPLIYRILKCSNCPISD